MAGLNKLKKAVVGAFWRDTAANPSSIEPVATAPLPISPVVTPAPVSASAEIDPEFYRSIEQEVNRSTPVEFAEFYNQLVVINDKFANLDENTRYQLAFNAAQTALKARNQNLTYQGLVQAVSSLTMALDNEKRTFYAQNDQGYQSNLAAIRKKVTEIAGGVRDCESKLESIQKEIDAFLAAKNQEKKKLDEERNRLISQRVVTEGEMTKLESTKTDRESRFAAAMEAHRQRIDNLKLALDNNLKSMK
jgi:hypothetical protein